MPAYRLLSNQMEALHHNGKIYHNGDVVIERVVLTEQEAKIMNTNQSWTKLEMLEDGGLKKPLKPWMQMNKAELQEEGKKLGVVLDEILTKNKMLEALVAKKDEISKS